jgi:rifampicin phosphotransferase
VEWAIAGGEPFMLQARPMTALPEPTAWAPPHQGWWLRNFRLGKWLPEPVTPLFETWLLPALDRGVTTALVGESGLSMALDDAVSNQLQRLADRASWPPAARATTSSTASRTRA